MFQILVVEDDAALNRSVCSFLDQSGYQATGCLNAADAYDAMYETVFDLIVSDIMMPGVDGFEFVKTVRALNENIPILFMTARDDFAAKQRGYRVGVDDYMVKPVDLDELFLRIGGPSAPGEDRFQPQADGGLLHHGCGRTHRLSERRGNFPDQPGIQPAV